VPAESQTRGEILDNSPVVVVSGLPRSGTSMTMAMLAEGGLPCISDNVRQADEDNPNGYFEDERAKTLDTAEDTSWLCRARGKAVKIVSPLLKELPPGNEYKILFMLRDLDEVLASQKKMVLRRGEHHDIPDDRMKRMFENHLVTVEKLMKSRPDTLVNYLEFRSVITHPRQMAEEIRGFLARDLDVERMVAVVDERLYRNRRV